MRMLSPRPGPYVQILTSILSLAESSVRPHDDVPLSLAHLLEAYDTVLRQHNLVPEEDSHFYRFLLRLSLEPYQNWWDRLYAEQLIYARRHPPGVNHSQAQSRGVEGAAGMLEDMQAPRIAHVHRSSYRHTTPETSARTQHVRECSARRPALQCAPLESVEGRRHIVCTTRVCCTLATPSESKAAANEQTGRVICAHALW
jgi:hypothetical protein